MFEQQRKSYIEIGKIYFWTTTINSWYHLLKDVQYKEIIIESLKYLSELKKIDVFGFVIMPNHVHLIWRINELNGKETSQGSFQKFTAHEFKKRLKLQNPIFLDKFKVDAINKIYEFWKRDPLAIELYTKGVAYQKLDYIHNNPLAEHWNLASEPSEYKYSSASYYERGDKSFTFLKDLRDEY